MPLLAGSAYSKYALDLSEFRANIREVKKELEGLRTSSRQLPRPSAPSSSAAGGAGAGASGLERQARAAQAAALGEAKLATEEQRRARTAAQAAVATQRLATEEQRTATQAAAAAAAQDKAALATLRLAQAQDRAARGGGSGGGGLGQLLGGAGLGGLAGVAGIGFLAKQVVDFGIGAARAANSLEKTEATTRALSGSTARYAEVLKIAQTGQRNYGGTLEESLRGLGSLVNLSNRTGTELQKLDNVSRRLAIVDPVQGIEGANIALKEFLSGDGAEAALSLAKRFELPKRAIAALAGEGVSAKERLAGLDALLNQQGITNQVLTDRTNTTAAAYDRLGAAVDGFKTRIGSGIAGLFAPIANAITGDLERSNQAAQVHATLNAQLLAGSGAYQQYATAVTQANSTVGGGGAMREYLPQLTQAQFNFARSLIGTGTAAQDAVAKAQQLNPTLIKIGEVQERVGRTGELTSTQMDRLANTILRTAATGPAGVAATDSLILAYQNTRLTAGELQAALDALARQHALVAQREEIARVNSAALAEQRRGERGATDELTSALSPLIANLSEEDQKKIASTGSGYKLAFAQQQLQKDSQAAALGLLGAGDQAALLAQKYGIAKDAAAALIREQQQLAGLAAIGLADQRVGERDPNNTLSAAEFNNFDKLADQGRAAAEAAAKAAAEKAAAEAKRLADAQFGLDLARATTDAAKIAVYKRRLAATTDAAERKNLEAAIVGLQNAAAGRGAKSPLNADFKADLKLAEDLEAKLALLERKLATLKQGSTAYKQVLAEIRDVKAKIADEDERAERAQISAAAGAIEDRKARREEERQLRSLDRIAQNASGERQQAAADEAELIRLRQRQRALDLARTQREAGLAPGQQVAQAAGASSAQQVAGAAGASSAQQVAQAGAAPAGQPSGGIVFPLVFDGREVARVVIPYVQDLLSAGNRAVASAGR